ncbi:hypothetical protein IAT40_004151 [Kwoniella sp. CBS 6097]
MIVFAALCLLLLWGACAQNQDQKIPAPSVDCKSLDESTCRYNCDMISIAPPLNFIKTAPELIEFECLEEETINGLFGYGKETLACLKCIVSNRVGMKITASAKFWANICDAAWNQSIDKAIDMLEDFFPGYPGGYECAPDEEATVTGLTTTPPSTPRNPGTLKTGRAATVSSTGTPITATLTSSALATTRGLPGGVVPLVVDKGGSAGLIGSLDDRHSSTSGAGAKNVLPCSGYGSDTVGVTLLCALLGFTGVMI